MILKLGMDHKVLKVYKASTNDDHGLALTYVMAKSNLVKIAHYADTKPRCQVIFYRTIVVLWFLFAKLVPIKKNQDFMFFLELTFRDNF